MPAILRRTAEREIIREWNSLPASKRQTERQASTFAWKVRNKYPFTYRGDRYHAVLAAILEYQVLKGAPLEWETAKSHAAVAATNP